MDTGTVRSWLVAALVLAGGMSACNEGASSDEHQRRSESLTERSTTTAEEPFAPDPSETMLPSKRVRRIDWEAAESFKGLAEEVVPEELAAFYEDSPVPVLLPSDRAALESAEPTVGKHWYAVQLELDGREVTIEGDRATRTVDASLPTLQRVDDDGRGFVQSQVDGVFTLSFTAFGAAYTIDIECRAVDDTGTCTNPSFATEVANRLARLGGVR